MEGPPAIGLTSLGGWVHDEGDPVGMLGSEEAWAMIGMPIDSARAGAEIVGHVLCSIV